MRKAITIYLVVGTVVALITVALGWWLGETDFITSVRWQVAAVIMLGVELAFLLFIPANKSGQQFGPHAGPGSAPLVSSGADFYDEHSSRRLGDVRWLLVGIPILTTGIILLISL